MRKIRHFLKVLQQPKKYAASNPSNFEETWSFTATGTQIISLLVLFLLIFGVLFSLLVIKGPFSGYFTKNDKTIERKKLEKQYVELEDLRKKVQSQENYIISIHTILSGNTVKDTLSKDSPEVQSFDMSKVDPNSTENEEQLAEKVKENLRTHTKKKKSIVQSFALPVKGVISQTFDRQNHPGIDIVTTKDRNVLACLSGTVIYSGYTQKDGYILILDHANGYLSVYKHNKTNLKQVGTKVQMNDPIAIVGTTGENSSGPHLHFELWYNQNAVNPEDYLDFN